MTVRTENLLTALGLAAVCALVFWGLWLESFKVVQPLKRPANLEAFNDCAISRLNLDGSRTCQSIRHIDWNFNLNGVTR